MFRQKRIQRTICNFENFDAKSWVKPFGKIQYGHPKLKFFRVSILGKIGQENVFDDILERKKPCLEYKNDLKKSKIWDFSKDVFSWFW